MAAADSPSLIADPTERESQDAFFAEAYRELRKLARIHLRAGGRTPVLNTTTLIHESYLRLAGAGRLELKDRAHFMCYAARAMRSVIVDVVRKRQASRHGGRVAHVTLDTELANGVSIAENEILGIHDALDELGKLDARMARIVEMRYFAGMTEAEIAGALELTERTVRREWEKARLWLSAALKKS
jgi:RNA polymerase sigma factor (TIGR02999 family)